MMADEPRVMQQKVVMHRRWWCTAGVDALNVVMHRRWRSTASVDASPPSKVVMHCRWWYTADGDAPRWHTAGGNAPKVGMQKWCNKNQFKNFEHISKFRTHFKISTKFQNFDQISKLRPNFKILTTFQNFNHFMPERKHFFGEVFPIRVNLLLTSHWEGSEGKCVFFRWIADDKRLRTKRSKFPHQKKSSHCWTVGQPSQICLHLPQYLHPACYPNTLE